MEIERKWMVQGWPEADLPLLYTEIQEQGYVHATIPIVRIRREERLPAASEAKTGTAGQDAASGNGQDSVRGDGQGSVSGDAPASCSIRYILCMKSAGRLAREEIELDITKEDYDRICSGIIEKPMIRKLRRVYGLPDGTHLEVNLVDEGLPSEFMYAEVEFDSVGTARAWDPATVGLGCYLSDDVTEKPGQSMSAYWIQTRLS